MRCPLCAADETRVVDSRPSDAGSAIRRRRECQSCTHRFTTYERVAPALVVRKRDGSTEPFDARKIRRGLEAALADRPLPVGTIDGIVAEAEAMQRSNLAEVTADEIGRLVLERLRSVDEVAYLRFASVYKEFQAAEDFEREVAALEGGNAL